MYTSYGKANDRFGFETKGQFRCAMKHDRLTVTICAAVMLVWIILIIINVITYANQMSTTGAQISEAMYELIHSGSAPDPKVTTWGAAMRAGLTMITTVLGLIILFFMLLVFLVIEIRLHRGNTYTFEANDESFTVIYPPKMQKEDVVLSYDDILGISWETRKFPLVPECYDISIKTRSMGFVEFRVILTKLAKANGITETPFNLIREKIGLADPDERYLINRGIKKIK